MDSVIKYGISLDYLPDWGVKEALREIYQNFNDHGDYEETARAVSGGKVVVNLSNNFYPNNFEFLRIGTSGKRDELTSVGEHGEGLKMALLVLYRLNISVYIKCSLGKLMPTTYVDDYLGECFGIKHLDKHHQTDFNIKIILDNDDYEALRTVEIAEEDTIYKNYYGALIRKNPGDIYVGGTFVCNLPGYKYAYNFSPEHVRLDRDRSVPKAWDIKHYSGRVHNGYQDSVSLGDLDSPDFADLTTVPETLAKMFKPESVNGNIQLVAKDVVAKDNIRQALMKHPIIAKRVARLKATLIRKRKPIGILKDFYEAHVNQFGTNAKSDFNAILVKAKDWK